MYVKNEKPVHEWNRKCGNKPSEKFSPEYWKALENQAERLSEELKETIKAIKNRDAVEVLDGQVDLEVVLQGFTFLSQFKHDEAFSRVCENNNLKYTKSFHEGMARMESIAEANPDDSFRLVSTEVKGQSYHTVIRDSDGKIMKPVDHPKVSLADLINDEPVSVMLPVAETCTLCKAAKETLNLLGIPFEELNIKESKADAEFCNDNFLDLGDIAFYDGTRVHRANLLAFGNTVAGLTNWLQGVGYNGKAS